MLINNYFKDEVKIIKNCIDNLPKANCLENFITYVYQDNTKKTSEIGSFEREYINNLYKDFSNYIVDLYEEHYKNKTKEQLIETLIYYEKNGGGDCLIDNDRETLENVFEWLCDNNDDIIHSKIKNFMEQTLDSMLKELETNKKQEEKNKRINNLKQLIKSTEISLKKYQKELDELLK